jgi:hypothetical protein
LELVRVRVTVNSITVKNRITQVEIGRGVITLNQFNIDHIYITKVDNINKIALILT